MSKTEKVSIKYSIGQHPTEIDTVVITISGTGINVIDEQNKFFLESMLNLIATQMYAKANDILMKNIKY